MNKITSAETLATVLNLIETLSSHRQRCIPILPHRLVTKPTDEFSDFLYRAVVSNVELLRRALDLAVGRPFARSSLHNPSAHRVVNVFLACAGVSAWLSVTAGAH